MFLITQNKLKFILQLDKLLNLKKVSVALTLEEK